MTEPEIVRRKPTAKIFCAKRAWNQKAETGIMRTIETDYRKLAERISTAGEREVSEGDSETITSMYCLWCIRNVLRNSPIEDKAISGVEGGAVELTKDNMEQLEAAGIISTRPDSTIPGRHLAGIVILRNLDAARAPLRGTKWVLREAVSGEFVVPDQSLDRMILPLSPTLCFVHESEEKLLEGELSVEVFNELIIADSLQYYFARKLPT